MSRPKAVYELQCWNCEKIVEFEVDGPHRCPRCGAAFEIVREEQMTPEPDVDSGAVDDSTEKGRPATGAAQRLYEPGGLWATVGTETEIVPGVAIPPVMARIGKTECFSLPCALTIPKIVDSRTSAGLEV